jgi:hypothetical protein
MHAMGSSSSDSTPHPAFAADRVQTMTMLRQRLVSYEDVFRELFVILGLDAATTSVTLLPEAVERCLRDAQKARGEAPH